MAKEVRHILALSGGKDSTALAIYMRDKFENLEYVFCDTKKELPETYEYLDRIEGYLGQKIERLCADRGFDHYLTLYGGYLPSARMRWCTNVLKIKPFEEHIGQDEAYMYVGIRADEDRAAYVSRKSNIHPVLPFKDDGITKDDVFRMLEESGIGLPDYYRWRTRSGCYFCFFQRKGEWAGLLENHPDLFEESKKYEKIDEATGDRYTWSASESLEELAQPERLKKIRENHERALAEEKKYSANRPLFEVLNNVYEDEDDDLPCFECHL